MRIVQVIAQGSSTLHLANESGIDSKRLLERPHKIQVCSSLLSSSAYARCVSEAVEMYQNFCEKGATLLAAFFSQAHFLPRKGA